MSERSKLSQLPGSITDVVAYYDVASSIADERVIWINKTGATVTITGFGFAPDTAITGANTNHMVLQLQNKGTAGTGSTAVTSAKSYSSGVDVAAFDISALTLSTTAANLDVDDGEVLSFKKTEVGEAQDLPNGLAYISYKFK